ncbi:AMP-dependent synthetase [Candidatus Fermentibacteria bacterium]|nr:MAG: AMP-dependent synthetase [Candidatus Fermentibacteria bacterium]
MEKKDYPGGPLRNIKRYTAIPLMLEASALKYDTRAFMRERSMDGKVREVSFHEIMELAHDFARGLIDSAGSSPIVAVSGKNCIDWAVTFLGTLCAGGIVVPIDRELPAADISGILHYSGATVFVFDSSMEEELSDHIHSGKSACSRHFVMNGTGSGRFSSFDLIVSAGRGSPAELPQPQNQSDTAVISYTSGTMGAAKGVVLSHGNILSDLQMMLASVYIASDEVFLSVLPFHHMYECVCGFLCPLQHGCTVAISRGLRDILEDLSLNNVTMVLGVPLLWEGMYRRIMEQIQSIRGGSFKFAMGKAICSTLELMGNKGIRKKVFSQVHNKFGGKLRTLISGGAALDATVMKGFRDLGIRMLQGYGLTECSPIVAVCRYDVSPEGTVGPPLPEVEVRIEEADSEGAGEIFVRGPNVMQGYHNNPEATQAVLSPDGWFRTGDFGILRDGVLTVTGRKKNIIVAKNGKNVYPEEIEHQLNRSSHVVESLVFGRETETKGEEIWTIIFPDYDALIELAENQGQKLTEEFGMGVIRQVIRSVNKHNPSYKRISNFILRETEFPKTTTRKIRRPQVLREAGLMTGRVFSVAESS